VSDHTSSRRKGTGEVSIGIQQKGSDQIKMHSKGFSGTFFFFCGVTAISRCQLSFVNEFITPFVLVLVGLLFLGSICASVLTVWPAKLLSHPTLTVLRPIFHGADSLPL
jgi:hypothetical protein